MAREIQSRTTAGSWKQTVMEGLYRTGVLHAVHGFSQRYELRPCGGQKWRLQRVRTAKYAILTYHRVGTGGAPLYCKLPKGVFEDQMRYIARNYRVISVRQMTEELDNPQRCGQAIAITFDDGYLGTYKEAYPVLRKYNLPVTVYLSAAAIETGEILWYDRIFLCFQKAPSTFTVRLSTYHTYSLETLAQRIEAATEVVAYLRSLPDGDRQQWCRELEREIPLETAEVRGAMMTWEQAREMQRGGVHFGAHTMTHPVVSRLQPDGFDREIGESKRLIEQRLNSPVDSFAFPFGKPSDCGQSMNQVLTSYGFRSAMTSIVGLNEPGVDPFRIRRLGIGSCPNIARFAFQLQRAFVHPVDEELSASHMSRQAEESPCETT